MCTHVKVLYCGFYMSRWVKDQLGHGTPRKQNVVKEACSITKIRHRMLPTSKSVNMKLYIRIIVYGIYIHIPKVKPLAKHLHTSPPPFQHSQKCFQEYWGVPGLRKMDKFYAFSWESIDAQLKYSNFYLFASHLIGRTKNHATITSLSTNFRVGGWSRGFPWWGF